ncbi:MAG: family 10 glycosylhydrolase [Bacteroidota bacterium]|nr:family 10 glycosylhydrolase [Bacteroidota bacterium]
MKTKIGTFSIALILILIAAPFSEVYAQGNHIKQEMRGVWVATTKNIDYPSSAFLTVEQQKAEFIDMLNLFESLNINAVMLQVRPAADAFFPSRYEPWSEWLTGVQGKAPNPYYDPLKFMIKECRKRGIEFHAWVNPFRAVANIETADVTADHVSNRRPDWVFTYGINKYFNPGIPEVRHYINNVVCDIVRRYDVDGIHFDDYFYPYPTKDENRKFISVPDYDTYIKYGKDFDNIDNWRRNNLNVFIRSMNDSIKAIRADIKFGIAPSGVWRNKSRDPKGSDTRGFAHYDYLYADVLTWLKNEWIDYVAPQLYWSIGHKYADYQTLVDWWSKNCYNRHLYIGHGVYMADTNAADKNWRNPSQLPEQMRINKRTKKVSGSIFYKASALQRNAMGFNDSLKTHFYASYSKTPEMPWLLTAADTTAVIPPDVTITDTVLHIDTQAPPAPVSLSSIPFGRKLILSWTAPNTSGENFDDKPDYYKVYRFEGKEAEEISPLYFTEFRTKLFYSIPKKWFAIFRKHYTYVVTSVDKAGNESEPSKPIHLKFKLRK